MKNIKFILAMLTMVALFSGIGAVKANTQATIASGATNSSLTVQRKVTGATGPVTSTFTYTITADSANPATATGIPTSPFTIAMSNQAISSGTATKTATLSFVGAKFTKPGDYKYVIKETASSNSTTYPVDTTNTYTVLVSVRNHTATDFTTAMDATILLYTGSGSSATKKTDNTTLPFTSAAQYRSITLKKTVEGTGADTTEAFPFTVAIKGGVAGDVYSITGGTSPTSCTVAASATSCNVTVSLKHNETATITGVKNGQTYSITETSNTVTSKYQTYINGSTTNNKATTSDLTVGATNTNTVKNTYNPPVPTGLILKYLPL